jgi:16S rRNA (cytosine1402-N4)-methyltransferase
MGALAAAAGVREADAVLLDLGVSSMQLDEAERGFGFLRDAALDMRMDTSGGPTAAEWIASVGEEELAEVLREYGEEPQARRVARAIVRGRLSRPIRTTGELAELVSRAKGGRRGPRHPATQAFQAIRMRVNGEIEELREGLADGLHVLKQGGRMAVIAFHSVEDRVVKQFVQSHVGRWESLAEGGRAWRGETPIVRQVNRRVIRPSSDEVAMNPRARSARLRVFEKGGD